MCGGQKMDECLHLITVMLELSSNLLVPHGYLMGACFVSHTIIFLAVPNELMSVRAVHEIIRKTVVMECFLSKLRSYILDSH